MKSSGEGHSRTGVGATAGAAAGWDVVVAVRVTMGVGKTPRVNPSDDEDGVRAHEEGREEKRDEGAVDAGEDRELLDADEAESSSESDSELAPSWSAQSPRRDPCAQRGCARAARATSPKWKGLLRPPGAGPAAGRGVAEVVGEDAEGRGALPSR